ncbi:MAG: hypothetical protein Q7S34_01600 [bacterium]|nr:hypothetical protein [bacterium]
MSTRTKAILNRLEKVHEIGMSEETFKEFPKKVLREHRIYMDLDVLTVGEAADEIADVIREIFMRMSTAQVKDVVQQLIDQGFLARLH